MATNLAPGVHWKEYDLSSYIPQISSAILGIVITAPKGPINERVLITSKDELVRTFGSPTGDHYGLYGISSYLDNGNTVWVVRVESSANPSSLATTSLTLTDASTVSVPSFDNGGFYNDISFSVSHNMPRLTKATIDQATKTGTGPFTITYSALPLLNVNTVKILVDGTQVLLDDGVGTFTGTVGYSGTVNYDTGEITLTFDADPVANVITLNASYWSSFDIVINQNVRGTEVPVEIYNNLNLETGTSGYYYDSIGGSRIVNFPTGLTAFPQVGTYQFSGGADGLTGISPVDYIGDNVNGIRTGIRLFELAENVDINILTCPGQTNIGVRTALVTTAEVRADCMTILDTPQGLSVSEASDWLDGKNDYSSYNAVNSSFATCYYPWLGIRDPDGGATPKMLPPSVFVPGVFAKTDAQRNTSWAPAGSDLGRLTSVTTSERELSLGDRGFLDQNRINAINNFPTTGTMIYGQRTCQVNPTALDRVNVRRTLSLIEKTVVTAMQPFVFKPHVLTTWVQVVQTVQPYLDGMVASEQIQAGEIVCNSTTNTQAAKDRSELIANIFIKPTKSAEIITINFVVLAQTATISEYLNRQF